jgi:hypothetical protein
MKLIEKAVNKGEKKDPDIKVDARPDSDPDTPGMI